MQLWGIESTMHLPHETSVVRERKRRSIPLPHFQAARHEAGWGRRDVEECQKRGETLGRSGKAVLLLLLLLLLLFSGGTCHGRGRKFLLKKTGEEQKGSLLSCGAAKQRERGEGEKGGDDGRGLDRVSEAASFLCIYFLGGRSRRRRRGEEEKGRGFCGQQCHRGNRKCRS